MGKLVIYNFYCTRNIWKLGLSVIVIKGMNLGTMKVNHTDKHLGKQVKKKMKQFEKLKLLPNILQLQSIGKENSNIVDY